jgi:hypothetical protein
MIRGTDHKMNRGEVRSSFALSHTCSNFSVVSMEAIFPYKEGSAPAELYSDFSPLVTFSRV